MIVINSQYILENDECGHGKPLVEAMRFARCLCASGRNMAVDLIARHGLMERIVRYVSSTDPRYCVCVVLRSHCLKYPICLVVSASSCFRKEKTRAKKFFSITKYVEIFL